MERLTEVDKVGAYLIKCRTNPCKDLKGKCGTCAYMQEVVEKLAAYENMEKQGLLLKLPCKVGDTVWELCKCNDGVYRIFPMIIKVVVPYGSIRWIKGKKPMIWNIYARGDYTDMYKSVYDFDRTVFLTKEEAEQKLHELQQNKS